MNVDLDDPSLLFTEAFIDDPAPVYAALRERAPVWEMPGTGSFVVASARLVAEAVGRPDDFSSNLTSLLYTGDDARPAVFDMTHLGPGIHVLATADPPVHTLHRRLLQPLFSPGAVDARATYIDDAAAALVRAFVAQGGGNAATAVSEPLPVQVICSMIGIPDVDVPMLEPLVLRSNDLLAGVVDAATMAEAGGAAMQVTEYLHRLVSTWQPSAAGAAVCDHLAGAVAAGEVPIEDTLGMVTQLLGAGTDTTTSLISRAVLQLAIDQALQQSLRERPDRVAAFLEETLRFDGPFRFHYRAVRNDTELGGVRIPAGSRLLLLWASANLDTEEFDHADRFDVERTALRSHYAFGRGMHFCIGAPLARAEARAAITQLLAQTRRFSLTPGESPAWRRTIFVRRLSHLPLDVDPA